MSDVDLKKTRRKKFSADPMRLDRTPPHSIEAEQGTLGAILLAPRQNIEECIESFGGAPEVFYDLRHEMIFKALVELYDADGEIDLITLQEKLKQKSQLEAVGGFAYLASLPDKAGTAGHLGSYVQILKEKYNLRIMLRTASDIVGRVYEHGEDDPSVILDECETELTRLRELTETKKVGTIKEYVKGAIDAIEREYEGEKGILSGFHDLDRLTNGFQKKDMIVIAARPSMGKTSLAMGIAEYVTLDCKIPVGVFSLEMSAESIVKRMIYSRSRVDGRRMREGQMAERDFPKLTGAAGKISGSNLFIDDTPAISVLQLRSKARKWVRENGVKLLVIDYLQLMQAGKKCSNRQEEVAAISNGIKALAKELDIPIIVLSQLNRETEATKKKWRKPQLSDLRESGAIEQDADIVGLLYKQIKGDDEEEQEDYETVPTGLIIAKQRNGPTGEVSLTFLKNYTRFESAAKVSDEDVPH